MRHSHTHSHHPCVPAPACPHNFVRAILLDHPVLLSMSPSNSSHVPLLDLRSEATLGRSPDWIHYPPQARALCFPTQSHEAAFVVVAFGIALCTVEGVLCLTVHVSWGRRVKDGLRV
ncbi:uncharacterized protein [Physcomitrium patens]|uniref:Uncharacterized protein n=1 Tax=Physcomitrium patens TaxID=3218 RepID=A0A7I4D834_PHYPA